MVTGCSLMARIPFMVVKTYDLRRFASSRLGLPTLLSYHVGEQRIGVENALSLLIFLNRNKFEESYIKMV